MSGIDKSAIISYLELSMRRRQRGIEERGVGYRKLT
jgi:hypothetical protein